MSRLRRARGPRSLGRALSPPAARDRADPPASGVPDAHHRPRVRPRVPGPRRARLSRWRHGHSRRSAPRSDLLRAGPRRRRVPAGRALGGLGPCGAGGVRVDARLRVPARGRRRRPAAASGSRARRTGRHGAHLEPPRRARAGPPPVVPARAGPRLRLGGLALGDRRAPGRGAVRGRARGGGLRPLDPAAAGPARPDRDAPPTGRCAQPRSQRASCCAAESSPTRPSPDAGPRQDVEQPVER